MKPQFIVGFVPIFPRAQQLPDMRGLQRLCIPALQGANPLFSHRQMKEQYTDHLPTMLQFLALLCEEQLLAGLLIPPLTHQIDGHLAS